MSQRLPAIFNGPLGTDPKKIIGNAFNSFTIDLPSGTTVHLSFDGGLTYATFLGNLSKIIDDIGECDDLWAYADAANTPCYILAWRRLL